MPDDTKQVSQGETDARSKIGRHIVYWALGAVTLLGLAGIACAAYFKDDPSKLTGVKDIISMILPVVAAWVGTVLAFYFSRENYAAAAENNAAVLNLRFDQRLQAIPVTEVMIPIEKAEVLTTDEAEDKIKLKDDLIDAKFDKTGRNRLPILNGKGIARYVVHRSIIDKSVAEKALSTGGSPAKDLTLKDLVDNIAYKPWINSFGTVERNAKMSEVKALMDRDPKCADVFVTEDGTPQTRVIGWITNVALLEKLKA